MPIILKFLDAIQAPYSVKTGQKIFFNIYLLVSIDLDFDFLIKALNKAITIDLKSPQIDKALLSQKLIHFLIRF